MGHLETRGKLLYQQHLPSMGNVPPMSWTAVHRLNASPASSLARVSTSALPMALAVLAFVIRLSVGPQTIDDAYITFRYARNLAAGLGFVYNPGQHVIGTTTPLYTMILAVGYRLGVHDLPHLALALGSLADAGSTVLLYSAARRFGFARAWASLAAGLFAVCGLSIAYGAGGMETPLFTLLVVAALTAAMADRGVPAGILAGLALLTRPEGILVIVLIVGSHFLARRAIPWHVVVPAAAIYLPWLAYAYWWTGSPLSESVVAKASAYGAAWLFMVTGILQALSALGLDSGYNVLLYTGTLFHIELGVLFLVLFVTLFVLARTLRIVRSLRQQPTWCPFVLFAPVLVLAYLLAGVRGVKLFPWYLAPLAPFYMLGAVAVLRFVASRISRHGAAVATALFLVWTGYGLSLGSQSGLPFFAPRGLDLGREKAYEHAAAVLAPQLRPGAVVALPEIGAFGYFSNASVLDTNGLVSPVARKFFPLPKGEEVPAGLICRQRPDWLISLDVFVPSQLRNANWFRHDYRLVRTVPVHFVAWNARAVVAYHRRTRLHMREADSCTIESHRRPRTGG